MILPAMTVPSQAENNIKQTAANMIFNDTDIAFEPPRFLKWTLYPLLPDAGAEHP